MAIGHCHGTLVYTLACRRQGLDPPCSMGKDAFDDDDDDEEEHENTNDCGGR